MTKSHPPLCDGTEISNMAASGHSNMAAVSNDKTAYCEAHKIV